jgi:hypothetical protein
LRECSKGVFLAESAAKSGLPLLTCIVIWAGSPQGGYDCIVMDPPWENKSAKRSAHYPTLPSWNLLSIPIKRLLNRVLNSPPRLLVCPLHSTATMLGTLPSTGVSLAILCSLVSLEHVENSHASCAELCGWQERGLLALWVTNRERHRRFVKQKLLPAWGLELLAIWFWLKVTDAGELVSRLVQLLSF